MRIGNVDIPVVERGNLATYNIHLLEESDVITYHSKVSEGVNQHIMLKSEYAFSVRMKVLCPDAPICHHEDLPFVAVAELTPEEADKIRKEYRIEKI